MPIPNYESVGIQTQSISDLSGGMVTAWNYRLYSKNQVNKIVNSNLAIDGAISTRNGRSKLNDSPVVAVNNTVRHLAIIGQSGSSDLILGAVYDKIYDFSSGTPALVRSGLNSSAKWSTTNFNQFQFWVNGFDRPFMTQGTAATTYFVGIVAPLSMAGITAIPAAGGVNSTAGAHRLTFRYRSTITQARSNPPIIANAIQFNTVTLIAGQRYQVTIGAAAVSSDPQVDLIDVFVQEAAANLDAPYYYLGTTNNVNGSILLADVADDELIVKESLDVDDNPAPSSLRVIEEWRDRLVAISDDYHVRFSKLRIDANGIVNLPTSWPAVNELVVGNGDGDPLVTIIKFNDYVFAFKRRSVWILQGEFGVPGFGFKRLKTNLTNVGLLNQYAIAQAGDKCYFVSDDLKFHAFGYTDFSTTELRLIDPPLSDPIANVLTEFASAFRDGVRVVNFTFAQFSQVWIAFNNGTGISDSYNFNILVFDYYANSGRGAWHLHMGHEVASAVLARDVNRNYFVYTGDYAGIVWKHDLSYGDGAAINGTSSGLNSPTTLNDVTKNFVQTPSLIGCFVKIIAGTGAGQIRRINAVPSPTQISVSPAWGVTPNNTSQYTIGGFLWEVWSRFDWCDEQTPPDFDKLGWYLDFDIEAAGIAISDGAGGFQYTLDVSIYKERSFTSAAVYQRTFKSSGAIWDFALWDFAFWDDNPKTFITCGMNIYFKQIWHKIGSELAGQAFRLNGWTYTFQNVNQLRVLP